mmetsp:Transcript_10295/g.26148  ORF Transcript_10295/g.26148 Transcript_10295/m.26148 type:complete len:315 (-) Transcript_10295:33-977(-)
MDGTCSICKLTVGDDEAVKSRRCPHPVHVACLVEICVERKLCSGACFECSYQWKWAWPDQQLLISRWVFAAKLAARSWLLDSKDEVAAWRTLLHCRHAGRLLQIGTQAAWEELIEGCGSQLITSSWPVVCELIFEAMRDSMAKERLQEFGTLDDEDLESFGSDRSQSVSSEMSDDESVGSAQQSSSGTASRVGDAEAAVTHRSASCSGPSRRRRSGSKRRALTIDPSAPRNRPNSSPTSPSAALFTLAEGILSQRHTMSDLRATRAQRRLNAAKALTPLPASPQRAVTTNGDIGSKAVFRPKAREGRPPLPPKR